MSISAAADITIGHHVQREFFGMTFNLDTIWSTLIAGGAVLLLGFMVAGAISKNPDNHVPSKLQIMWEATVGEVNKQVEDNLGRVHPYVTPLAISLFFFVLFANWLEALPTKLNEHVHLTPPPTADVNLTYALAALTMISVWVYGIRLNGLGYFKHFTQPYPALLPLTILEELVKPITLALRLFGNIFAGGIMLSLISLIPWYMGMPVANIIWKLFGMFIGGIQAFIFALLTVIYFAMAGGDHHDDEHDDATEGAPAPARVPEPAH